MQLTPSPPASQTTSPFFMSYARMRFDPLAMTSVRSPSCTTSGVDQDVGSSRATLPRSSPVRLSRATRQESPAFPRSTGEAPSPNSLRVRISPKSFSQITLPPRSRQYSPREPKKAQTCSPSVTGEADA